MIVAADFLGQRDESVLPEVIDFLGQKAPLAFRQQPALPVSGSVAGKTGPIGTGGTGRGLLAAQEGTGVAQQGAGAGDTSLRAFLQGANLLQRLLEPGQRLLSSNTIVAPETVRSSDIFADAPPGAPEFAPPRASAPPPLPPGAFGSIVTEGTAAGGLEGAELATQGAGTGAGAAVGQALPYAGAALNIGLNAALSDKPAHQQALEAAYDVIGAAFAPETFGLSLLASTLAKQHTGRELQYIDRGQYEAAIANLDPILAIANSVGGLFGADLLGGLFGGGGPSNYVEKRQRASETAQGRLASESAAYTDALRSGDLGAVQKALSVENAPGLYIPVAEAARLGIPGTDTENVPGALGVTVATLSPEQFGAVLDLHDQGKVTVTASGDDVPYLPARSAGGVQVARQSGAEQLLSQASRLRRGQQMTEQLRPATAPESASAMQPTDAPSMSPGGGGRLGTELTLEDLQNQVQRQQALMAIGGTNG